jgi:predicted DNA binding CopG/RHH family protein
MKTRTADYTDDKGEIVGDLRRIADTLPRPDQLVLRDDTVKVTLALSRQSVEFFKREAAKQRVPYQRMIRALVDEYTQRMR